MDTEDTGFLDLKDIPMVLKAMLRSDVSVTREACVVCAGALWVDLCVT